MSRVLFLSIAGLILFTNPVPAESLKFQLSRAAVVNGKALAPCTYYIHTPAAGDTADILIVSSATGEELPVTVRRTAGTGNGKALAVFAVEGTETRLKEIRTRESNFEFAAAPKMVAAE